MIVSGIYLSLFILSVIALYILVASLNNRHGAYYVILFTLISVVCLAYFSYSIAVDAGMALVSNQFSYLDCTLVMMFFIFCFMDVCNVRIRRGVAIPWVVVGLVFLFIPFTAGHNGLFYESYELAHDYGASHLIMEFGPLNTPFMIYVTINMSLPLIEVLTSFFYKKKISYKISISFALLLVAIYGLYFVQEALDLGADLLPIGYVLMEYVILGVIRRISFYDVSKVSVEEYDNSREYGCIIFDKKGNFMGSNTTAQYFFPEVTNLGIDREVNDEFIKKEFVSWIDEIDSVKNKVFTRKDRKIVCTLKPYIATKKQQVYGYIVGMHDDTEQQVLIEKLNELNENLERAVEDANNANIAKSRFLANMSHEIRTPINAMLGMNELAMQKCENAELLDYMRNIDRAGHNLMDIINDILDFSKIEAGKIEILEEKYDLAQLVTDVEELLKIKAVQKNLVLNINISPEMPSVLNGDENRIRQIIINILNNAVKYTHEGSVTLDISAQNQEKESLDLIIKVTDTGIGIKPEDKDKLFESFSRVDESRNRNIEGTGLGLAITYKLIQCMNGKITVNSEYGKGSEFIITIPQRILDASPICDYKAKVEAGEKKKKEIQNIDATGQKILVVDDTAINLKITAAFLKPTKADITTCLSGMEALELMEKEHFDIVLLDHMMPEMDGVEVLQKIKESSETLCKESIFIIFTANAISGAKEEFMEAGFDDYVSKPVNSATLLTTIGKYI